MAKKIFRLFQVWNNCHIEVTLDFPYEEIDSLEFGQSVLALASELNMQAAAIFNDKPHSFETLEDISDTKN